MAAPCHPRGNPERGAPAGASEASRDLRAERAGTWWSILRDAYFTFDRRTLGFTRILLGLLLIGDLARRTPDWIWMYGAEGVLPSHVNLARPQSDGFSIFNAFSTRGELWTLWAIGLIAYLCLLVGYKTRIAHVVALVFVTSMNGRVLLIENGGYVVQNLLVLWTCFLPMGDRFSVDALLASLRRARERGEADLNDRELGRGPERSPYVTLIGLVVLLQLSAVYFFNVVHKTGPAWKNGTAVHYVLYTDRMVTPLFAHVRDYAPQWLIFILSKGTLVMESALVVCLLVPLARPWARRAVVGMMNALHIGFGSVFVLGPFAWSCCTFSTLLFGKDDWDLAHRTMRRPHRARDVLFARGMPRALAVCRVLKRLDNFELLTFRESDGPDPIAVRHPETGEVRTGASAFADIVAALPLGPLVAWIPKLPGVRAGVEALVRRVGPPESAPITRARETPGPIVEPEPSPLLRSLRRARAGLREAAIAVMLVAAIDQALVELWVARPLRIGQPQPFRSLTHKMRFLQGWFMFSPNPVTDDGTIVVDAVLADGRHIDPFTGRPPDFDLGSKRSLRLNQIWCDYFNRMHLPHNTAYREAMKEFILRYPERTGRPDDAIVSAEIYWVKDLNPALGRTQSTQYERVKLFSFEAPTPRASLR